MANGTELGDGWGVKHGWLISWLVVVAGCWADEVVFINEIHYDNASFDQGEGVEIAGVAGTDLGDYRLEFYNGNGGALYDGLTLSGVIDNEGGSGAGAVWFGVEGIQNGGPDGVALVEVDSGRVLEFLSYEGEMTVAGVGASVDIGVSEGGSTAVGDSLQRTGKGVCGADFSWVGPVEGSAGFLNAGQVIEVEAVDLVTLTIDPGEVSEAGGVAVATVRAVPAEALELRVGVSVAGEVDVPGVLVLDEAGTGSFEIRGLADGLTDGDQVVEIRVDGSARGVVVGEVVVRDVDTPDLRGGALRVASYNLENGAGAVGTAKHGALEEVLRRVDADVVGFQEVSGAGDFADLKALLGGLGYGVTRLFLATEGDAFEGEVFDGGDFGDGQFLALASRYPIVETVQIGRGDARAEMTRFPLYVAVDVPGVPAESDPHFVVVHYKAGSADADRFRKAVEAYRTVEFLAGRGLDGRVQNVFVLGDFNEDIRDFQPASFDTGINTATHTFTDGSGFPVSYDLGDDLEGVNARTIGYARFPRLAFGLVGVRDFSAVQVDGSDRTRNDFSPRRLDYLLQPLRAGGDGSAWQEVFNSDLEPVSPGLPKAGPAVRKGRSRVASDHQVVFGDFELVPRGEIGIKVGAGYRVEGDERAVEVTVKSGGADAVRLVARPPDEVRLGREVLAFGAGETETVVEVFVKRDGVADPDVGVVLSGTAEGFSTGHGTLVVRNVEASGRVIVSQYHEPSSGSSLKALEIMNVSGEAIDFYASPLEVRLYANGSEDYAVDALVEDGVLRSGGVVVIGDGPTGDYLVRQGVIADPGGAWGSFFSGTVFPGSNGDAGFVIEPLNFNGDDALEVLVDRVRADVIGRIGEDPGVAWTDGESVGTSGQNLERLPWAVRGSSGWSNPGLRFGRVSDGNSLEGFGVAPALVDRYGVWAHGLGVGGEFEDPDFDGVVNLWEYAWVTAPDDGSDFGGFEVEVVGGLFVVGMRRRAGAEELVYTVEVSGDGVNWEGAVVRGQSVSVVGDGTELVVWTLDGGGVRLVRVRVEVL